MKFDLKCHYRSQRVTFILKIGNIIYILQHVLLSQIIYRYQDCYSTVWNKPKLDCVTFNAKSYHSAF